MLGKMTIKPDKAVVSAAVGLIEIGVKQVDTAMVTPLPYGVKPSELAEFAMAFGSLGANYMGIQTEKTEILFYSSLPLLEVALAKRIMEAMAKAPVTYVPPSAPEIYGEARTTNQYTGRKYTSR